jgi:hypothetical protein
MALMSPQVVSVAGLTPVYTTPTASDTIAVDVNLWLHVKTTTNADTVTLVDASRTPAGAASANLTVALGTSTERLIGPLDSDLASGATGLITVTHSSVTGVTAALFRI